MKSAVELFSGIGGWHSAVCSAQVPLAVVKAFDVNTVANEVYETNFPSVLPSTLSLERVEAHHVRADVWLLSPPCQPHTSAGKQLDVEDARSRAFLRLVELLPVVRPEMLLLENTPLFRGSHACRWLHEGLAAAKLHWIEFALDATAFGTPNERRRFYLVARRRPFDVPTSDQSYDAGGAVLLQSIPGGRSFAEEGAHLQDNSSSCPPPLSSFLQTAAELDARKEELQVRPSLLRRADFRHNIALPSDRRCAVFTKAYGKHVLGGPLLSLRVPGEDARDDECDAKDGGAGTEQPRFRVHSPGEELRLFSSEEISRLMQFPHWFHFPHTVREAQRRRLLGNALNVRVATELIRFAFMS